MRDGGAGRVGVAVGEGQFALRQANVFLDEQRTKAAAVKADKPPKKKTIKPKPDDQLITELFDLDRDNPWFGQTVEDVEPPKKEKAFDPSEPRDETGKWTSGGGSDGGGKETGGKSEHPGKGYSASARVIKGVIHTGSVYDAQRALFENRKVELSQPKEVSTLIKKLGETAAEMAERGEQAPVFNLCNVSIEGTNLFCSENKGIPRAEMPVIPAKQTKAFVKHLKSLGYEVEKDRERADHLRATQSEISGAKVAASMKRIKEEGFYKRLVVSRDDYILDGHHTWAGQVGIDIKDGKFDEERGVKVYRVDISITKLIDEANKWTKDQGIAKKPASEAPKGYLRLTMEQAAVALDEDTFARYFEHVQAQLTLRPHIDIKHLMLTVRQDELRDPLVQGPL